MIAAAAILVATWIIFAAVAGPSIGRALRDDEPPAPEPVLPADATAEEIEAAVWNALFVDTVCREFPYDADKFAA